MSLRFFWSLASNLNTSTGLVFDALISPQECSYSTRSPSIGLIVAFMTAFYMFRTITLTFMGEFRGGGEAESEQLKKNKLPVPETIANVHLGESPRNMIYPILILSFFAIFVGYLANPVFSDLIF